MEEKTKEIALKLLEVCKDYTPIDNLNALSNLYCAFVETQINEPVARILAYTELIEHLNNRISETSETILSEKIK